MVNVYDKVSGNKLVTFSQNVSEEGKDKWEELAIGLTATQAVDIEVVCENTSSTAVFFDEISVKVQSVPTVLVVQENHYYPFGLGMRGLDWTLTPAKENKFQYNGGVEKNTDFDLNWYETDFRRYDPQIGRLTGVDALAGLFPSMSPYVYAYNNPMNFNDPTGLCTDCATDENDFTALAEKYAVRAEPISVFEPVIEVVETYTKEVKKDLEPHLRPDNVNKKIDTFTKGVESVVEDNNLDLLPIGYLFLKAWGLYGKQILIYGGTALASGLYGIITSGGGAWITTNEAMSLVAAEYQTFVTGQPANMSYLLNDVKFDGIIDGVLVDAKSGYDNFLINGTDEFHGWFKGAQGLVNDANRQIAAANGTRIQWHFQKENVMNAVQKLFNDNGISGIELIFNPN